MGIDSGLAPFGTSWVKVKAKRLRSLGREKTGTNLVMSNLIVTIIMYNILYRN